MHFSGLEEETWKLEAMGSDRQGCLRRSLEQDVVDHRLVGVGEVGDRCWPCVDDMEVGHGQQFRFPVLEPVARRRPLTLETMAVATTLATSPLPGLDALRHVELVERALNGCDEAGGDPRIARGRLQLLLLEQRLDRSDISAAIEHMRVRGERVPAKMTRLKGRCHAAATVAACTCSRNLLGHGQQFHVGTLMRRLLRRLRSTAISIARITGNGYDLRTRNQDICTP